MCQSSVFRQTPQHNSVSTLWKSQPLQVTNYEFEFIKFSCIYNKLFCSSTILPVLVFQIAESSNAFLNRMLNRDTITRITYKSKCKTNRREWVYTKYLFILRTTMNGSLSCVITLYLHVRLPIAFRTIECCQGRTDLLHYDREADSYWQRNITSTSRFSQP